MADIFLYADETGNLDYNVAGNGATQHFGFGTAVFDRDHGAELWSGMRLRAELSRHGGAHAGIDLRRGFHAKDDSHAVKTVVYQEILRQAPRFDVTLLKKGNAYPYVQEKGEMYMYKFAFFKHLSRVAPLVATADDTLYVIVASFGTAARRSLAQLALEDVCHQTGLNIALCVWDSASSWGLQVADYGLWAAQRVAERADRKWFDPYVAPTLATEGYPWGR